MLNTLTVTPRGDREIVMTRAFNAPRRLVYEAMTSPELLAKWLAGPPGWETSACENDVRVGGAFRHAWRGPDGAELAMAGVYREVVPPERIVRTETFEIGCEGQAGEQIGTLQLDEQNGRTLLTLTIEFPTREARDATLASGMEHGVRAGYDRLDELLASAPAS